MNNNQSNKLPPNYVPQNFAAFFKNLSYSY